MSIVSSIRTPTNYVGAIHKRLQDGKLQYMKSHDYHVLMQQVRYFNRHRTCRLLRVVVGTNISLVNIDILDARADNPHDTYLFARHNGANVPLHVSHNAAEFGQNMLVAQVPAETHD